VLEVRDQKEGGEMSEFQCRCGGLISHGKCSDCDHPYVVRMDGMTAKEIAGCKKYRLPVQRIGVKDESTNLWGQKLD